MDSSTIKYRIAGIELVYKSMEQMLPNGVGLQFLFDLRVEVKILAEHKIVILFVTVKIRGGDDSSELANIGVSCLFEIDDFEKHISLNEQGLYIVPPMLETVLRPIAISTARGVMYSELRGTYLNNAIMPIVEMTSLKTEKPLSTKEN